MDPGLSRHCGASTFALWLVVCRSLTQDVSTAANGSKRGSPTQSSAEKLENNVGAVLAAELGNVYLVRVDGGLSGIPSVAESSRPSIGASERE